MKTSKIAIGSWAFSFGPYEKNPWTFEQVCKYAGEHGYDGIEINGFRPHPHPDDYATDEKCAQLKAMIESYGLGISGFAADFRDVPPALVSEAEFLSEVKKCLEFCRRMGIDVLRVDTITAPDAVAPELYHQHFKNLTDNWRAAAELCKAYDVLMVWEFEPGFWLNKPSEVKLAVDTVNHPNFKLLFDSSHAYMCAVVGARHNGEKEILKGGVNEFAAMVKDQIGHWHLIDCDGTLHNDETSTHSPFGTGQVDFKSFMQEFKDDLEQANWWTFDFCFCPTTEIDAKDAIPYIKRLADQIT
ncbi:sugar phosphate isomerase/epimerase [Lentisphaera profundi]|uniref:Sugar phosphate isomerase/epimerase n=1 Tax=Lentisphaera profundi TaxID=1658616 RepID=A0ABY7VZ21_9BACT|nr:sugar phosphate isomerase/epimerase family protein [Lentisphaera profundi]WDE99435.1 sugar phosphate isomerase/epimerase [Lentisphaera profundi]